MRRWVSFFFPIYQRVHWICLFFFFFNSLIFFTFFFFPLADLGVRCVCERNMVETCLLVEEVSLE